MLPTSVDVHAFEIEWCVYNLEHTQNPQDKQGVLYQTFNVFKSKFD